MTIPATVRRSPVYTINGVATTYAFGFKVTDAATVVVTEADENDLNSVVLDYGVDYTVTLNPDQEASPGGEVNYSGGTVGHRLVITSDTDSSQPTAITNLGAFHANVLEAALDRIVILHQQQQEQLDRCVKAPVTSEDDPSLLLDAAVSNASNYASAAAGSALAASASASAAAVSAGEVADATALRGDLADTADVAKGDALLAVKHTATGAAARSQHGKNMDVVSVLDFIPVAEHAAILAGTSTYNCTADIANAVAAASALYAPGGLYNITQIEITKPFLLFGDGAATVFKVITGSTSIPIYVHAPTSAGIVGVTLRDFVLNGNSQNCQLDAGGIQLNTVLDFLVENVEVHSLGNPGSSGSSGVNGITVSVGTTGWAAPFGTIRDCYIHATTKGGINVSTECIGVSIIDCTIRACTGNGTAPGVQINGATRTKLKGCNISGCEGNGVLVSSSASGDSVDTLIEGCTITGNGTGATDGAGVYVVSTTGSETGPTQIVDCTIFSNGVANADHGVSLYDVKDVLISGGEIHSHRLAGVYSNLSSGVTVRGVKAYNNAQDAGLYAGIQFAGAGSRLAVIGNHCYDDQGTKTQAYALKFEAGAMDQVTVKDNAFDPHKSGEVYVNTLPTKCDISFNARAATASGYLWAPLELAQNQAYRMNARITGRAQDNTAWGAYDLTALLYRAAGAAAQVGATTNSVTLESDALWGATIGPNANSVDFLVAANGKLTDWHATIEIQSV